MKIIQRYKGKTIQCSYQKCGTHARVLFTTLAYGNSKNEIRQETIEEGKYIRVNI